MRKANGKIKRKDEKYENCRKEVVVYRFSGGNVQLQFTGF